MSGRERCDEILRLIDQALAEAKKNPVGGHLQHVEAMALSQVQ
ncbi:MAG: hypothetical protein ACRDZ8_03855 [Acidimicrobiales bacterium]